MTKIDLDELEALAKAATPGPWYVSGCTDAHTESNNRVCYRVRARNHGGRDVEENRNRGYIAAFNPAVTLALIAEVRAARAAAPPPPPPPRPIVEGSTWRWGYHEDFRARVLDNHGGCVTYQYLDPEKGTHTVLEANFRKSMLHVSDPELDNEKESNT